MLFGREAQVMREKNYIIHRERQGQVGSMYICPEQIPHNSSLP